MVREAPSDGGQLIAEIELPRASCHPGDADIATAGAEGGTTVIPFVSWRFMAGPHLTVPLAAFASAYNRLKGIMTPWPEILDTVNKSQWDNDPSTAQWKIIVRLKRG